MASALDAADALPAACRSAVAAVRREWFIPDRCWAADDTGDVPIDRRSDPQRWRSAVRSDRTIVTQYDDGDTEWPEVGIRPSSSSSMPSVMLAMLAALDLTQGQSVLEIGTGSGYNAALLAELVGPAGQVTTLEIDPGIAADARDRLDAAGYGTRVRVLVADGASFTDKNMVWDRVIATTGAHIGRLPYAWIKGTRPGGIVLAPCRADFAAGPLVRFVVHEDGTATGYALPEPLVNFMEMRGNRIALPVERPRPSGEPSELSHTLLRPTAVLRSADCRWALAVAMPGCRYTIATPRAAPGHRVVQFHDPLSDSWASVYPDGDRHAVRQAGPRRLWDEAEAAYRWWLRRGEPAVTDWEWTVTRDRQRVGLAEAS